MTTHTKGVPDRATVEANRTNEVARIHATAVNYTESERQANQDWWVLEARHALPIDRDWHWAMADAWGAATQLRLF